jgi:carbamoyltransferase
MRTAILGISAYYHDSAAALLVNGRVVAAAQEERFTRRRHDAAFPIHACRFVLEEAGIPFDELSAVAFYDKPFLKFERLLETYHAFAPSGLRSFAAAMPVWIKEKLFMRRLLAEHLRELGSARHRIFYPEHHLSHAASAFYPSPFDESAILTIDGVGEWATTTIGRGRGKDIEILSELQFPHSVGLLYSAFTYFLGFTVNSGEYKLMGLAPYGNAASGRTKDFVGRITSELVDILKDGSMLLNMPYFDFATGLRMVHEARWERLFGMPRRDPESEVTQSHMDLALAAQEVTEEIVLRLARTARDLSGSRRLTMAGGVALNCVANGKILESAMFDDIWIQPAAGDAGGALGAAYAVWHIHQSQPRRSMAEAGAESHPGYADAMSGSYLGPEFSSKQIVQTIDRYNARARHYEGFAALAADVASRLAAGEVGGWFQGRMEFGPRALGGRSILADPRDPKMRDTLNMKIKFREGFRPFAPSVLEDKAAEWFETDCDSPYMLLVAQVREGKRVIPSVTHVDNSARLQTVTRAESPLYYDLIAEFGRLTGVPVVINTSFNVRGEPIVCTPHDAHLCFMRTNMDQLVMGHHLLEKKEQPALREDVDWRSLYELD